MALVGLGGVFVVSETTAQATDDPREVRLQLRGFHEDEATDAPELTGVYAVAGVSLLLVLIAAAVLLRIHRLNVRLRAEIEEREKAEAELRKTSGFLRVELESQERGLEALAHDLAHQKRELQRALSRAESARERAEDASRAKSRFLAMISHELRSPLTSILGHAELLRSGEGRGGETPSREQVDRIRESALQLSTSIDELLVLAGVEGFSNRERARTGDAVDLVRAVVEGHREEAEQAGLSLHLEACEESISVRTDFARLRAALDQLLENAVRFTEEGSVTVNIVRTADELRIAVSDTGTGVPPEQLSLIFEPFVQAEQSHTRRVGGMGVGLTLARAYIRAIGGEVEAESREGGGSVFTLSIPIEESEEEAPERPDLKGLRIMVVDDDPAVRTVLTRSVERSGGVVEPAEDAEAALERLAASDYDVVLSDISMPGKSGISLARDIRIRWPSLVVVLVSGAELDDWESEAAAGSADAFLRKPFEIQTLVSVVRGAVSARATG